MPQVDFYVLPETTSEARWLFACRLIEKVQRMGMDILVAVDTREEAQAFDELLWTFKPESFIPHQLLRDKSGQVDISFNNQAGTHQGLLINLSARVPEYFGKFQRLSEIVVQEPQSLQLSRERYGFYKSHGHSIETRKL